MSETWFVCPRHGTQWGEPGQCPKCGDIAKMNGAELVKGGLTMADAFRAAADSLARKQPQHTDILLGDDGRGSMFWKIICSGRVQEVNAPLPKGYTCVFCGEAIRPTTSVVGADPSELMQDTTGMTIEPLTKETIKRVIRERREQS